MESRFPKRDRRTGSDAGRTFMPAKLLEGVTGDRRRKPTSRRDAEPRKEGAIRTLMNSWWDRLLGGVSDRSFSAQEAQYASHRTKRDFMWNSIGLGAWGMVFPLLTIFFFTSMLDEGLPQDLPIGVVDQDNSST